MSSEKPYHIVLIEDNPAEVRLIQEAILEADLDDILRLTPFRNSDQVMEELTTLKTNEDVPDMMLVDLNMPGTSGKQILQMIKADEAYDNSLVFIFTNSDNKQDMAECYSLGAEGYLQKPSSFKRLVDFFIAIKKSITDYKKLSVFFLEKTYDELKVVAA